MTIVTIENLTKVFPGSIVPAIENISLEILSGSLTAILGPSGCGKTTTLKIIAGLLDHTSGDVTFEKPLLPLFFQALILILIFDQKSHLQKYD